MDSALTIGQAAMELDCNPSLLRFYEKEFELEIPRAKGGRRTYSERELEAFRYIARLKNAGYGNQQIKAVLKSGRLDRVENFSKIIDDAEGTARENPFDSQLPPLPAVAPQSVSGADLVAIFTSIAQLRDELNSLKSTETSKDVQQLMEENARLKAKIKEKTYELVDARERIQELTDKVQKKGIFRR